MKIISELEAVDFAHLIGVLEWTQAWYAEAVSAHFVQDPYQPTEEMSARLMQYFYAGLTPKEAVQACFGASH